MYYPPFGVGGVFFLSSQFGGFVLFIPKRFLITLFKNSAFISFFALLLFYPLPTLLVFGILATLVPFFYTDKSAKSFRLNFYLTLQPTLGFRHFLLYNQFKKGIAFSLGILFKEFQIKEFQFMEFQNSQVKYPLTPNQRIAQQKKLSNQRMRSKQ